MFQKSWKTTGAGIAGLIIIIFTTVKQLLDSDPTTNPDFNTVIPLIFTSIIGVFARDKNVSSEQQGIK